MELNSRSTDPLIRDEALLVQPMLIDKVQPEKSLQVYDAYPVNHRDQPMTRGLDSQPLLGVDSGVIVNLAEYDLIHDDNELENLLVSHIRDLNLDEVDKIRTFLKEENLEGVLTKRAEVIIKQFNKYVDRLKGLANNDILAINRFYDNKVELLAAAFETDHSRLESLLGNLDHKLNDLRSLNFKSSLDELARFLKWHNANDDLPSPLEEKLFRMAQCVQNRLTMLQKACAEAYRDAQRSIHHTSEIISNSLSLLCPSCNDPYDSERQALVLAPCGHQLCTVCFTQITDLLYQGRCIYLSPSTSRCPSCKTLIEKVVADRSLNSRATEPELDPRSVLREVYASLGAVQAIIGRRSIFPPTGQAQLDGSSSKGNLP
ncbi:Zinc-RING finger domain-containing protein [Giardia muris]|uniref:Zinc-RING finger domain-containing protein n=1 Tax=Giardia muris TaxID=5742 RepID=A0A4Z1ST15_GIAMU|nr:Zinc-RING finger domain-containing protein [Giardia muris]|eukprot:TNJ28900.1 Zinc-RING finger domain-containing protein [Giardia muris]